MIHLTEAYKDAVFYSGSKLEKLKYADSTINAAFLSGNNDIISDAFLSRGIVYHHHFQKHKLALDEYITAYQYARNSNNKYLKNNILYHISFLKSHLRYYDSALIDFQRTSAFFNRNSQRKTSNKKFLYNRRAYYNSLHQMIVCHRNLKNFIAVDSLISMGIRETQNNPGLLQEHAYFLKEKGIEQLRKNKFVSALDCLERSILPTVSTKDLPLAMASYFYIGQVYMLSDDQPKAMTYFQKVHTLFQAHHFVIPELLKNYELLIEYHKSQNDEQKELYFTKQLLIADKTISKDYTYLSSTIHRKYDTTVLEEERDRLERKTLWEKILLAALFLAIVAILLIVFRKLRSERNAKLKYKILEDKIKNTPHSSAEDQQFSVGDKCSLDDKTADNIIAKLQVFEEKEGFVEKGLTINKLASKLRTNSNYLSQIINEYKGMNFNRYISELRIRYITDKLHNDKTYLNYKIETLAEKCGIASRTNFSNLFQEINGMRPKDFIKNRLKTIEETNEISKI